jgi:hypothetical protein
LVFRNLTSWNEIPESQAPQTPLSPPTRIPRGLPIASEESGVFGAVQKRLEWTLSGRYDVGFSPPIFSDLSLLLKNLRWKRLERSDPGRNKFFQCWTIFRGPRGLGRHVALRSGTPSTVLPGTGPGGGRTSSPEQREFERRQLAITEVAF